MSLEACDVRYRKYRERLSVGSGVSGIYFRWTRPQQDSSIKSLPLNCIPSAIFLSPHRFRYTLLLVLLLPYSSHAMQRGGYGPPPANSPPLHHPVPQHVSTVPMMRSPPPPQSQGGSNYGSPYAGQTMSGQQPPVGGVQGMTGGQFAPAFGGFMNDQTAQMGLQVGQKAFQAGQEAMEQSVRSHCISAYCSFNPHPCPFQNRLGECPSSR